MSRLVEDSTLLEQLSEGALQYVRAFGSEQYGEQLERVYAEVLESAETTSPPA